MKFFLKTTVALGALCLSAGAAIADCAIGGTGSVRILSNDFEALRLVNTTAGECASATVKVTANANAEHKNLQVPALSINPAEYTVAVVANNSIVPLLNGDLIRPLGRSCRQIWSGAAAQSVDQDRWQDHGYCLYGQCAAPVLSQGYSRSGWRD